MLLMTTVKIFVSHSTKYSDIAQSLKNSLQTLEPQTPLDIQTCEAMPGATDWRQWIEENVRSADIFLLLFPNANMDLAWSAYEFGRFYEKDRKVVCIKNTDISKPPPQFDQYQAYDANEVGIRQFIDDLFVNGTLTGGKPINTNVGRFSGELYKRAHTVACELAQKFAQARVKEQRYVRRIVLSVRYDETKQFDVEASTVQGNADGLQLLGLGNVESIPWSTVRKSIGDPVDWPSALEAALPFGTSGALPPALPPFIKSDGIYIPVIVKASSVDGVLEEVVLIFVLVTADRLQPILAWSVPKGMPDAFALLVRLIRMIFKAQWDILEPRYREVTSTYRAPTLERCAEIARTVVEDFEQISHDLQNQGIQGFDQFYAIFSHDLKAEIEACDDEFKRCMAALQKPPLQNPDDLSIRIKNLLDNNSKWLELGARQFSHRIGELR
jgi:hypothetical protein